jgi:hypothetical protein
VFGKISLFVKDEGFVSREAIALGVKFGILFAFSLSLWALGCEVKLTLIGRVYEIIINY